MQHGTYGIVNLPGAILVQRSTLGSTPLKKSCSERGIFERWACALGDILTDTSHLHMCRFKLANLVAIRP